MSLSDADVREILRIIDESQLDELRLEMRGFSLHVRRGGGAPVAPVAAAADAITAPMLGTFYRASAPGEAPFVSVGDEVEPDTIVCLIEVMKLMNAIPAGVAGRIVEVCADERAAGGVRRTVVPRGMKRVFVANRGEIAVRIIRACQTLGLETVVGVSDVDRDSMAARLADRAVCIGPARSYLLAETVVHAAIATGCDALHPGYGFLSENPRLAALCTDVVFVGPPAVGDRAGGRQARGALDGGGGGVAGGPGWRGGFAGGGARVLAFRCC